MNTTIYTLLCTKRTALLKSSTDKARSAKKWTNEEIHQLKQCIQRFGHDVNAIAERMKTKTAKQIKGQLDKNAGVDSAGAGAGAAPALPPRDSASAAAATLAAQTAAATAMMLQQQQAVMMQQQQAQAYALAQQQQQQQQQATLLMQHHSGKRKADFNDDLAGDSARARLDDGGMMMQAVQLESAVGIVQHGLV